MIVFFDFKIIKFNGLLDKPLYEHGKHSELRSLLNKDVSYIMSAPIAIVNQKIRQTIALSEVIVFRLFPSNDPVSDKETIFLGILKLTQNELLLCLYESNFDILQENARLYFTNEPIFILDLDETLIFCKKESNEHFVSHFTIENKSLIDSGYFKYDIMLRPNVGIFLEKIFKITKKVYILTASDLGYAEEIVRCANEIGWGRHICIPLSNIYSTRIEKNKALLKTFNTIIPLSFLTGQVKMIAIDDNIGLWEPSLHKNVLPIKPFEPGDTEDELMKMYNYIEKFL